ncbi:MAG: SPFH domain-containing protein [Candidatus Saccharimonadaceae bacterium]
MFDSLPSISPIVVIAAIVALLLFIVFSKSMFFVGEGYNAYLTKNFGGKSLDNNGFIALHGENGVQTTSLATGPHFRLWPMYRVRKVPIISVPDKTIAIVISQIGAPIPTGSTSAAYNPVFGNFENVKDFVAQGGQQGIQRHVLTPGTYTIHPDAFIVVTVNGSYGRPVNKDAARMLEQTRQLKFNFVSIPTDKVGIVTALDGPPLEPGTIAGRIGNFDDIKTLEEAEVDPLEIMTAVLSYKNAVHANYQDAQAFLTQGGRRGLQHDVLMPGDYAINPFLFNVTFDDMLVVEQGQVAVIKAYVGLPTVDTSGETYKFGSIVDPGHEGIWSHVVRTGKKGINQRIYAPIIVPTSILQLNWADNNVSEHGLDRELSTIVAKSKDAFEFAIELEVQIHIPDTNAAKVIGSVESIEKLVKEVLQAAVGNYFRDSLSKLAATEFIETRSQVQHEATEFIKGYLAEYYVEVRGVYIQDVKLPEDLATVLRKREIANQEKQTYGAQRDAEEARIASAAMSGQADMQQELAQAQVSVAINQASAEAAVAKASGDRKVLEEIGAGKAAEIRLIGEAQGKAEEALGLGKAAGYTAQRDAIGPEQTAMVAVVEALGNSNQPITPKTLIMGGSEGATGSLVQMVLTQLATAGGKIEAPASTATGTPVETA